MPPTRLLSPGPGVLAVDEGFCVLVLPAGPEIPESTEANQISDLKVPNAFFS